MYGLIYKITNLINDKVYVGQTTQELKLRLKYHKSSKNTLIGRAIRKYGWENFSVEVLEECETQEQLNEREIFCIKKLNSKNPNGYNLTNGGERNYKVVESVRRKISLAGMGRKFSDETKAKISASNKKHYAENNPERRLKISIANTGNQYSKGRVLSLETRKKIVYPVLESELNKLKLTHCGLAMQMDNVAILAKLNGRRNLDLKTAEAIKNFLEIDMPLEEFFRKNI